MNSDADLELWKKSTEGEWTRLIYEFKHFSRGAPDPTHRVSLLKSARKPVISVPSTATVGEAFTLMMNYNYSQLPVMDDEKNVKGIFGWRSYGKRVARGVGCKSVVEAIEPAAIIELTESVFEAFALVAKNDYVLVRDKDQRVCGIVTAYDVSELFATLAEPFLLLEEIEKRIRALLQKHVTEEELKEVNERRNSKHETLTLAALPFGAYIKLFEKAEVWARLGFNLDQARFVQLASGVRDIRNEVMHFRPLGLKEEQREALHNFAQFLRGLSPANEG